MVELANGKNFGPINIKAVKDFLNSGAVLPDSKMYHKLTGETVTVGGKLSAPASAESAPALETSPGVPPKSRLAPRKPAGEGAAEEAGASAQADELKAEIDARARRA